MKASAEKVENGEFHAALRLPALGAVFAVEILDAAPLESLASSVGLRGQRVGAVEEAASGVESVSLCLGPLLKAIDAAAVERLLPSNHNVPALIATRPRTTVTLNHHTEFTALLTIGTSRENFHRGCAPCTKASLGHPANSRLYGAAHKENDYNDYYEGVLGR
jgi:hypothetical protein